MNKITYTKSKQKAFPVFFEIKDSVLKDDFKALMRLSTGYDRAKKSGYIKHNKVNEFKQLAEKINATDKAACKKSHEKAATQAKNRKPAISFEDFCEDYLNQHVSLMSDAERQDAYTQYQKRS